MGPWMKPRGDLETARVMVRQGRVMAPEGLLEGQGVHAGQSVEVVRRGDGLRVSTAGGARHLRTEGGEAVYLGREPVLLGTRHTLRGADGAVVASWLAWAGMLGADPLSLRVWGELAQAADSGAAVWLRGDSGTGKERAARALHDFSPRGP